MPGLVTFALVYILYEFPFEWNWSSTHTNIVARCVMKSAYDVLQDLPKVL